MANRKLIEVALPLEKINASAAYEKMPGIGAHPRGIHLWWARRPFSAARAVIWSSIIDDPSSHPELFPTEADQTKERQRLFALLERLSDWKESNNDAVINEAKKEIEKYSHGIDFTLVDPFSGGGAIPLEAARLGIKPYAFDLNPVAVTLNKSMIEIPPVICGLSSINPEAKRRLDASSYSTGLNGLCGDVSYYGRKLFNAVNASISHLYPQVELPAKYGGGKANVVAWIWARTVKCSNPACGKNMPLISNYVLSKKKGREVWISPHITSDNIEFRIEHGCFPKEAEFGTKYQNSNGKGRKGTFCCPFCKTGIVDSNYIDKIANEEGLSSVLIAVVAEGKNGKVYLSPDANKQAAIEREINAYYEANDIESLVPHEKTRGTFASNAQGGYYGLFEFKDYFTKRQQILLATFCEKLKGIIRIIEDDALAAGMANDHIPLYKGGTGALAYSEAIGVYLAFTIDRLADFSTSVSRWAVTNEKAMNCFSKQAISMTWDYPECNSLGNAVGGYIPILEYVVECIKSIPDGAAPGVAEQRDAQSDCGIRNAIISTDPPYYDNVCYSDLSDFFYVWLRRNLKSIYPDLFSTMLVPKNEELIATPYRFGGDSSKAKDFFEGGMLGACKRIYECASSEVPVTIYYAYKQTETNHDETVSSGWETMLTAIIAAGFQITGTWPMRTEQTYRAVSMGTNALASSIVLVCRKRQKDAPICTRRNLINELKRELRPALQKLQSSNIAPVDLAQSAIGPGMGIYSKYSQVLEADGTPMSVRSALKIINQELDLYFNEQDSELDSESRFCVDLYSMVAFNEMKFGDANTLATAKGTSVAAMAAHGTVFAQKGVVHLIERQELPEKIDTNEGCLWKLCQQLTYKMEKDGVEGCAKAIAEMFGSNGERAKDLAYRLFTIAERKHWAQEAYAYNALVVAWPEIQSRAAQLKAAPSEQISLLDMLGNNDQN